MATLDDKQLEKTITEAWRCLKSQDNIRAIDMFNTVLAQGSLKPEYFIGRSIAQIGVGAFQCAIIDARIALTLDTRNSQGWFALAKAYYSSGLYEKAADTASQGLNIDPNNHKLVDIYKYSERKMRGLSDPMESVDWYSRDNSGKFINNAHSHSHSFSLATHSHSVDEHDHDHSHDHDHDHGHDHDHDHDHEHSHDHSHGRSQSFLAQDHDHSLLASRSKSRDDYDPHDTYHHHTPTAKEVYDRVSNARPKLHEPTRRPSYHE